MRALLFSTVIYLAGVAALLYTRPRLMFGPDGRWKEFGVRAGEETTPFPFWAFCLVWALGSYGLGQLLFRDGPVHPVQTSQALGSIVAPAAYSLTTPLSGRLLDEDVLSPPPPASSRRRLEEDALEPLGPAPPAGRRRRPASVAAEVLEDARPGYYRLNEKATRRNGVPRYIYVGPELPAAEEGSDIESA